MTALKFSSRMLQVVPGLPTDQWFVYLYSFSLFEHGLFSPRRQAFSVTTNESCLYSDLTHQEVMPALSVFINSKEISTVPERYVCLWRGDEKKVGPHFQIGKLTLKSKALLNKIRRK